MWFLFLLLAVFVEMAPRKHEDYTFPKEDIIELPIGRFPDPICDYAVRKGGSTGPPINSQVHVGDRVFHEWKCSHDKRDSDLYCMMVNNCSVHGDDPTKAVPILDEFGCSLFPNVLPHVEYSDDLHGGILVNAFSLEVDQAAVLFECNVKLLLKLNGICRRPTCVDITKLRSSSSID